MANPFTPGTQEFIQYQLAHPEDVPPSQAAAPMPMAQAAPPSPAQGTPGAIQAQLAGAAPQGESYVPGGRLSVPTVPANAPPQGNVAVAMGLPAADMNAPQVMASPKPGTMDPNSRVMFPQGGQPQQAGTSPLPLPPSGGGGGPVRVIPGRRTPQSWATTTEQGVQLSPETLASYEQAADQRKQAQQIAESAATDERYVREEAGEREVNAAMTAAEKRERADKMRAYDMEQAQKKYEAAKVIDPNRLWENKSGFSKAMDVVGAIAGGILVGMGRTSTNQYLDAMERAAQRDVQLQLKNLELAGDDIKSMYGQWDREDQKVAAGEKARLEDALKQLDYQLSGVKGQQQQAAYLNARADLQERIGDRDLALAKQTQGKTVVQRHDVMTKPQTIGGGGGGSRDWMRTVAGIPPEKLKDFWAAYKLNAETPGMTKDKAMEATVRQFNASGGITLGSGKEGSGPAAPGDQSLYVAGAFGGKGGYARTPKDAETLKVGMTAANLYLSNIRRLRQLRQETFLNRIPGSQARKEAEILVSQNIVARKKMDELGVIAGPDMGIILPQTGEGALDIISPNMDRALDVIESSTVNGLETTHRNYGMVPGTESVQSGSLTGTVTGTSAPAPRTGTTPFRKAGE
ncbi:MAG: hypothetical protein WC683_09475 [bacterium]|jgi:hypothetical protein